MKTTLEDKKFMEHGELLNYMAEYIISALEDLDGVLSGGEFISGQITAFVDCLEILEKWDGFKRFGITDVEKKFHIM